MQGNGRNRIHWSEGHADSTPDPLSIYDVNKSLMILYRIVILSLLRFSPSACLFNSSYCSGQVFSPDLDLSRYDLDPGLLNGPTFLLKLRNYIHLWDSVTVNYKTSVTTPKFLKYRQSRHVS